MLFDMYLLKINRNSQLLEVNYKNQIKILRLREKWSTHNDLHKHWSNFNGNIIFHACFSCVYEVLLIQHSESVNSFWEILRKECRSAMYRDIYSDELFGRNEYFSSLFSAVLVNMPLFLYY